MSLTVTSPAESTELTTLDTVKSFLGVSDGSSDEVLSFLIKAASDSINDYTNRVFAKETVFEKIPGSGKPILMLERTPVISVSEVKFDGTVMALSEFTIDNDNAGFLYREYGLFYQSAFVIGNIVKEPMPSTSIPIWEVSYIGGYELPSFASPAAPLLPSSLEMAAIDTVVSLFRSKGRDSNIKSEKIADVYSISYGSTAGGSSENSLIPSLVMKSLDKWIRIK